jgi:hypothetical protein
MGVLGTLARGISKPIGTDGAIAYGKCGASSNCSGGGGSCGASSNCTGGGGKCGASSNCSGS